MESFNIIVLDIANHRSKETHSKIASINKYKTKDEYKYLINTGFI